MSDEGSSRISALTGSTGALSIENDDLPAVSIAVPKISDKSSNNSNHNYRCAESDDDNRAVHIIRLSALEHNYQCVEGAANSQRCSVITVVKADGYGHGAVATALHLADSCGADAFAVATLPEAISLRKAFEQNPPGKWSKKVVTSATNSNAGMNGIVSNAGGGSGGGMGNGTGGGRGGGESLHPETTASASPPISVVVQQHVAVARCRRPAQIRILVLGPPVGFPNCFNDYYHYGIEAMISGPEVAQSLLTWVVNEKERKRTQVERAAMEAKAEALFRPKQPAIFNAPPASRPPLPEQPISTDGTNPTAAVLAAHAAASPPTKKVLPHLASTLGNVSGQDLAREVRAILMSQKAATEAAELEKAQAPPSQAPAVAAVSSKPSSSENSTASSSNTPPNTNGSVPSAAAISITTTSSSATGQPALKQMFGGIEAVAKNSRVREKAIAKATSVFQEEDSSSSSLNAPAAPVASTAAVPVTARRRLRWHALVDSGMGRLGFKTEVVKKGDKSGRRDTVDILQELVDCETNVTAPIEFFGMCTHMADANSTSTYTHDQIGRFVALLKRVRDAGISVPTVSTDNSAALLTTTLTHFDPDAILAQPDVRTRGYVRTGGAIYGQRPAFTQLRASSTLIASVRHVAVLRQDESVGYDRAYVAPYDVRIATLTIGFADGYPRELGNGTGKVCIRGSVFCVAGNVCMDMLMIELGPAEDTDGVGATVAVGDTAVLWGPYEDDDDAGLVRLQDLAGTLKTTQSALTCGLDKIRVSRLYI